jgi:hypothetical protein
LHVCKNVSFSWILSDAGFGDIFIGLPDYEFMDVSK